MKKIQTFHDQEALQLLGMFLRQEILRKYRSLAEFRRDVADRCGGFCYSEDALDNHLSGKYSPTVVYRVAILRLLPNMAFPFRVVPPSNLAGGGQRKFSPDDLMDFAEEYMEFMQHVTERMDVPSISTKWFDVVDLVPPPETECCGHGPYND